MHNLRTAAQRRECNWEWNLEEVRGLELIQFLLEEIQECRSTLSGPDAADAARSG